MNRKPFLDLVVINVKSLPVRFLGEFARCATKYTVYLVLRKKSEIANFVKH